MIFLDLIHNIALLVALSAILPLVARRWGLHTLAGRLASGLLFGAVVLIGMATPVSIGPGLIFDGRSVVLCAAGAIGGPVVAGVAAVMAAAYRIALGGTGAAVGVSVVIESTVLGVAFFYLRRRRTGGVRPAQLLALGLIVHVIMVGLFTLLPGGIGTPAMREVVLIAITLYPLATAVVCWVLLGEERHTALSDALAMTEEQLALAIEASDIGLWDWKVQSGELIVNDRWVGLVGYTCDELAPINIETWRRLVHPVDLQEADRLMGLAFSGEVPAYRCEVRMRHKNGSWVWVATQGEVTERDASGQPTRVTGTHIDVTERKAFEMALQESHGQLEQMVRDVAEAMGRVVEARDPYTQGHEQRVARLARQIAERMGLGADEVDGIEMAGLLHDVGKLHVPAEILTKPGRISAMEFALIKEHSQQGHDILMGIAFPWGIADMVLQHHERQDGSGYPSGLVGDEISTAARILAVADVVEAMASHRPYRPSLGLDAAIAEVRDNTVKYDADVVSACVELHELGLIEL